MFTYQGKTALVTGASSGIGMAFAQTLAARGMNLILVARTEAKLRSVASEVVERHRVRAEVIVADLSREQSASQIASEIGRLGLPVHLLVNNAGFGTHGHFETIAAERDRDQITVNVTALVGLTHALLPAMLERREGGVINIASNAAFQPLPYLAVYGATKAFVLSFSMALHVECRDRKVRVLCLCPGATQTQFFDVAGEGAGVGRRRSAEQVVETGLRGLERGRSLVVDGSANRLLAMGTRFAPRWFLARMAGRMVRPK